jgi:hypothetical protein
MAYFTLDSDRMKPEISQTLRDQHSPIFDFVGAAWVAPHGRALTQDSLNRPRFRLDHA